MNRCGFIKCTVFYLAALMCSAAFAQTAQVQFLIDNDGQSSGCELDLVNPAITLTSVNVRVTATIDRPSKKITDVSVSNCTGTTFGVPDFEARNIAIGLDNGVDGSDVIEISVPLDRLWNPPQGLRIFTVAKHLLTGSQDLAGDGVRGQPPAAARIFIPYDIPTTGWAGLLLTCLLLLGVGLVVLRKKQYVLAASFISLASVCFAAGFIPDGDVGDWAGATPNTTDPAGDAIPPDPSADIRAVFFALENDTIFARVDIVNLDNTAPDANADTANTLEEAPVTITLTGSDPEGDALTFTTVTPPVSGSLGAITPIDATSASVEYTPNVDFSGADGFTFKVNDGFADSAAAAIDITVDPVNDAPVLTIGSDQAVAEDSGFQSVAGFASGAPGGGVDESGQTVSFNVGNDNNALFALQPAIDINGQLTYTPAVDAAGSAVVTVVANDNGGTANGGVDTSAGQTFTINVIAENDPPVLAAIGNQSINELVQLSFTATATDPDIPAQSLSFSIAGAVPPGAAITAGGAFTWTPTEAQGPGNYTFDVVVTDDGAGPLSDTETITVTANEVNQNPVAADDAYNATGNVGISVGAGSGLITGDSDPDLPAQTLTFTAETVATANAGSATISPDGSFTYSPPVGFNGLDTFTYTLNDDLAGSDTGTVTLTVDEMIWFIDNDKAAAGNGTLAAPFNTLGGFEAVNGDGGATDPAAGDCIFIDRNSAGDYTGPVTLENNQLLIGKGAAGSIDLECGITLPANSVSLPATGSTRPVITSASDGIDLASGNTIRGLDIGNTTGTGVFGTTAGTLQASQVSILGTGPAIGITTSSTFGGVTFDTLQCATSSAIPCINLVGVTGTLGIGSGGTGLTQTGTGDNVVVNGGTVSFTYPAAISKTTGAGAAVNVQGGHATGTLAFSGTVGASSGTGLQFNNADGTYNFSNDVTLNGGDAGIDILSGSGGTFTFSDADSAITSPTGIAFNVDGSTATATFPGSITQNNASSAVSVTANSGTVSLSGNITASTGTANAFVATGGGTIRATHTASTITTTTGTGVNINGTTIGSGGVTFRSVSVNGASSGIILNNAGTGGFTITGDGATDGTGGTLQNVTERGIDIQTTDNISLGFMDLTNTALNDGASDCTGLVNSGCNAAVHLSGVTTVVLNRMDINGSNQIGINGLDVSGFTLANSTVTDAGDEVNEGVLQIFGLTGTSSIINSTLSFPSERVAYIKNTTGSLDLTVSNSTFSDSQSSALGADGLEVNANGTAIIDLTIDTASQFLRNRSNGLQVLADGTSVVAVQSDGSTFDRGAGIGTGVDLSSNFGGALDFDVSDSPKIYGRGGPAFNAFMGGFGITRGRLKDNADIQQGGATDAGIGVRINLHDLARGIFEVDGNTVSNIGLDTGIQALARAKGSPCGTVCTAGRLDAKISANHVTVDPLNSGYNLWVQAQEGNTVCGEITGNTAVIGALAAFHEQTSNAGATVLLENFTTDAATTWDNNGNTPLGSVISSNLGLLADGSCASVPTTGFPFD